MKNFLGIILTLLLAVCTQAQSLDLAENYLDQGAYEKAKSLYEQLYKRNPMSQKALLGLVKSHKELEEFETAEQLILTYIGKSDQFPNMYVELGYLYQLQRKKTEASKAYQKALSSIEKNPSFAYAVGGVFQDYNLLDEAIATYEKADELQPRINYKVYLARLYGEKGNLDRMFSNYIALIAENPSYFNVVSRNFNEFITEDPSNEANEVLRKLLLKEMQKNPELIYTQLLSWLYVQQKEFKKAFVQERSMLKREPEIQYGRMMELASIAEDNKASAEATSIYEFIIKDTENSSIQVQAIEGMMNIKIGLAKPSDYTLIQQELKNYIENYPADAFNLKLTCASFLAFQMQAYDEAEADLKALLKTRLPALNEANTRMLLADILVVHEKFNEALIYYTQVEKLMKNHPIGQEAKFKVAKTSYYKGDFDWALTQLDVLKKSTSQLMANDALELSRHIKDNSYQDSIQTALQKVAKADLYIVQHKEEKALALLEEVVRLYPSEPIEDEALYRMAKLHEKRGEFLEAVEAYNRIITFHPNDILVDNAYFALGELYKNEFNDPIKAKEYYEMLIFNHADSIFFVEAQKKYRKLRGDQIE
jgi:tetratricopeptide (TPR) repeat protein